MNTLNHLAIIADGNGRWAERRGLPRSDGHDAGLHKIEDLLYWCTDLHIPIFSVYCFSLDNWQRPQEEIDSLIALANQYFERYQEFVENNVKVLVTGVRDRLDEETVRRMERVQDATKECTGLILNLCVNYGGKREIIEAVKAGARTLDEIDLAVCNGLPHPDLIIRTGGYQRLSDFMLWEAAYAELYFTETYFPDFSIGELRHAVRWFETVRRKHGGL